MENNHFKCVSWILTTKRSSSFCYVNTNDEKKVINQMFKFDVRPDDNPVVTFITLDDVYVAVTLNEISEIVEEHPIGSYEYINFYAGENSYVDVSLEDVHNIYNYYELGLNTQS